MESRNEESSLELSSITKDEKSDTESVNDLLEECWFFENLFQSKPRMLRCYSDPGGCPVNVSSEISTKGKAIEEDQEIALSSASKSASSSKKVTWKKMEGDINSSSLTRPNLHKAPSLPLYFNVSEEDIEDGDDTRMSQLIQQAFTQSSNRSHKSRSSKGSLTRSQSISQYRTSPRSSEKEINLSGMRKMERRCLSRSKSIKSAKDLEHEEVQGFKDLGFTFDKNELSPNVINILPGLQEKKSEEEEEDNGNVKGRRRPYLSEAWLSPSCCPPPPVPNWKTKNPPQDMKEKLKFWARAVASNVRQEC